MVNYATHAATLARHLAIMPFADDLAALAGAAADPDLWTSVLDEAARQAEGVVAPVAPVLDRVGARHVDGRVVTPPEHRAAWDQFRAGGWSGLALPAPHGSDLPLVLLTAVEELFNRADPAFMMLPTSARSAAALLLGHAAPDVVDAWVPRLVSGEWAATIALSEPDAGSDLGRIRTRGEQIEAGWRITGTKCWISFGDHDLAPRIGHCLLARTGDGAGVKGLSLFLVPSTRDDGTRNAITVTRIEHKLGLHGSPTCVLAFDGAEATLIGTPGRGLSAMFDMMLLMRLSCGPQGTGVATGAYAAALAYAAERRQGGPAEAPPLPLTAHADVQRQLLAMAGRIECARGLNLVAATAMDLARRDPDATRAAHWSLLAQVLLPLVKDGGAWCAQAVASAAIQVFGGAGFTREWPVEQAYRDARVFPLFEGTSGIQALDLLHRRLWRDGGAGLALLTDLIRTDAAATPEGAPLLAALASLDAALATLTEGKADPRGGEAGAAALLDLVTTVAQGWIAARIVIHAGDDAVAARMRAGARFVLGELAPRAAVLAALATAGAARLDGFADLIGRA